MLVSSVLGGELLSPTVIVKIPKYNIPVKHVEPVFIDIDKMLPHEEIVTKRLEDLKKMILDLNAVDMPLIVAPIPGTNKYLIVDGHHRWAALKELGARKAPAIVIDYFDPSVKLYTWYPAFSGELNVFLDELMKNGVKYRECRINDKTLDEEELGKYAFIIVGRNGVCIAIEGGIEEQKKVSAILDKLNVNGKIKLAYYGVKEDAFKDMDKGEITYVLLRKIPTKEEVMKIVKEGKVFSPKTTRHVLPYIPAKTYTPLEKCY